MIPRRQFLHFAALAAFRHTRHARDDRARHVGAHADQSTGRPRGSEFVFARLRYESGDWDYNPKVAANVLDSIVQYTSIPVYQDEVVISASSTAPSAMTVSFTRRVICSSVMGVSAA